MTKKRPDAHILLAKIGAPHGVKGEVRVKPFGDPAMLDCYGKLHDAKGNAYKITRMRTQKAMLVVKFKDINTRNQAEALNGVELFVERSKLPEIKEEDAFYVQDLIGMDVLDMPGAHIGTVIAMPNFGAGDLLEIAPLKTADGRSFDTYYLPFTKAVVPYIDFDEGSLKVLPPVEVGEKQDEEGA